MNLLVGSRDDGLRRRIGNAFRHLGGRLVTTASSGQLLVHALDEEYDLAVIDGAGLDGMPGTEAVRILRQIRPRLPVLFLTFPGDAVEVPGRWIRCVPRTSAAGVLVEAVEGLTESESGPYQVDNSHQESSE